MKPVRLLAISASLRKNGNTEYLMDETLKIAEKSVFPVEVKKYKFSGKKFGPCLGCLSCYKNGGVCVVKDDFFELRDLWNDSDAVIYYAPVYAAGIPGQLKCFIDRLGNEAFGADPRFGNRHNKPIGAIIQGGDFFGGAEFTVFDIMRHAGMLNCLYTPPDGSYFGSCGWVYDTHAKSMREKFELNTKDHQVMMKTAYSVIERVIETAAIVKAGVEALKDDLSKIDEYKKILDRV